MSQYSSVLKFLLSEIGIIIFGRYSVFPAIVVDEGSPVVVIQQGLHAKGGGDPNEEQKRALRRRLHTEWCVIAKTKAILVMGVPIWHL